MEEEEYKMRNIKSTDRFKIWEIVDREGYAEVRMSESRKIREDSSYDMNQVNNGVAQNGYIGTNWYYVRFTGHAYNKLKEIAEGDTITNVSMDISREPYFGDINAEKNAAIDMLEKANVIVPGSIPRLPRVDGTVYPRNVRVTVFSFNTAAEAEAENSQNFQTKNMDKAPQVAQTPVAQPVATPAQPVMPAQPQVVPVQPVAAQPVQYTQTPVQTTVTATPVQPVQYAQPVAPVQPVQPTAAEECPF